MKCSKCQVKNHNECGNDLDCSCCQNTAAILSESKPDLNGTHYSERGGLCTRKNKCDAHRAMEEDEYDGRKY